MESPDTVRFFYYDQSISSPTAPSNVELKNHKNHFHNEFVKAFFSDINFNQKRKNYRKFKSFLRDFFEAKNYFKKNEKLSTNHTKFDLFYELFFINFDEK
jgi:hypothetical protein